VKRNDVDVPEPPLALPSAELRTVNAGSPLVFSEFAGKNVLEFDIIGLEGPSA
jgi:hypothetical protein